MIKKNKLLFVCAANLNRSPSFEHYFKKNLPQFNVKSCGVYYGYPERLNEKLLKWADIVYVMDLSQEMFIANTFKEYLKKVKVIGVSDQYDPDSFDLIEVIEFWINKNKIGQKKDKKIKTKYRGLED
jgi:predicted protein tyrosine phosphatase